MNRWWIIGALAAAAGALLLSRKASASEGGGGGELGTGPVLERGKASFYGGSFFDGKPTASGETFLSDDMTAASRTIRVHPPTVVDVVNLANGRVVRVRVNDRGPFAKNSAGDFTRILDLSQGAAEVLDFIQQGLTDIEIRQV